MKVGDLVTYGNWFNGESRIGVVLESDPSGYPTWFIMWSDHEPEWELENELEVLSENR